MNRSVCLRYLLFLIGLPLILAIEGCNFSSAPWSPTPNPGGGVVSGTVAPTSNPWPPTPNPGSGVVIGKVAPPSKPGYHFTGQDLYLGTLLPADQPNSEPAVTFTFGTDPGTTVHNPDGTFAFTDVAPGTYVLLVWAPENSFVVKSPEGGLIKVFVEKDKVTDLGKIILP
jgi:hypothetical protein